MTFEASVKDAGGLVCLEMRGELDGSADDALNTAHQEAIGSGPSRVLLNFSDVSYINSTGIALIVGLIAQARGSGRSLSACGLTDHYKEIFEITRIAELVDIFDDEEAAVTAAAKT